MSIGEDADSAAIVGPIRCARTNLSRHWRGVPDCTLTCSDAVQVIICSAVSPYPAAPKCLSIATYRAPGFTRSGLRSGSVPKLASAIPAPRYTAVKISWSARIEEMADQTSEHGGPESSTAPPGSKVIALDPGRSGTESPTSRNRFQVILRCGAVSSTV
ncbi:Uncharacterised protein [Mycobacteroides abscessus]|nr:Uncharacterised protein [Mycobacteroides abscessus]CQA01596.1 Uncharacterised protein [Mycobacteroides abscessus]CQA11045.1 Uncharacterised protein [Mycobacteroides abscessus]SHV32848.1 Uncharacterised protein [Mycobacteroides abscessus subsp. abscessus]